MDADGFWSRTKRTPSGCIEWQGCRQRQGYGWLRWNGGHWLAHRVAWFLTQAGPDPGVCVLHRCDNPPCVNPAHLFLGDRADNNRDTINKGRKVVVHGEAMPQARMTSSAVVQYRRRHAAGETKAALAREAGVSYPTMVSALTGKTWKAAA